MKVITVASIKGGVGKTTSIAILAQVAKQSGLKTLMLDADVQASLTRSFVNDIDDLSEQDTVYDLMTGDTEITPTKIDNNLYLIPASIELLRIDDQPDLSLITSLRTRIPQLFGEFDLVLIDTPGTLKSIVTASLTAAHHVYSPLELAKYSIDAFAHMSKLIKEVQQLLNQSMVFEGFLANRVRAITVSHENGSRIPVNVKERDLYRYLESQGENMILGLIATRNEIRRLAEEGKPLPEKTNKNNSIALAEMSEFAENLLSRAFKNF